MVELMLYMDGLYGKIFGWSIEYEWKDTENKVGMNRYFVQGNYLHLLK